VVLGLGLVQYRLDGIEQIIQWTFVEITAVSYAQHGLDGLVLLCESGVENDRDLGIGEAKKLADNGAIPAVKIGVQNDEFWFRTSHLKDRFGSSVGCPGLETSVPQEISYQEAPVVVIVYK
jgi:hypothetical protein